MQRTRAKWLVAGSALLVGLLALSGWHPYDFATWTLEVLPVVVALPILWATYRRFPLTTVVYVFIFLHALVLMLGGAYTYARVPFGFHLADLFGLQRSPYDKIGHFFQGFVPALIAILIRGRYEGRRMLAFLVVCVVLAVSAAYELIEWAVAFAAGQGAVDFLGTQGDPWDAQSDMFFALVGAAAALVLLTPLQDRQIRGLERDRNDS